MGYEFSYDKKKEILLVKFTGDFNIEKVLSAFKEILKKLIQKGWSRTLVDVRGCEDRMSILDNYNIAREWGEIGFKLEYRMAIIYKKEQEENFKFLDTTMSNRGNRVKVFLKKEDALDWLA